MATLAAEVLQDDLAVSLAQAMAKANQRARELGIDVLRSAISEPPRASLPGEVAVPARDRFHDSVKTALVRDGWTIRELVYNEVFEEPIGQLLLENDMVRIVVFSEETEEVLRWIP